MNMKRFLTLMAAVMTVMAAMAQSAGIVLSYNKGKELKFFKSNQLAEAIEEAEVNDTIYFGAGKYDLSGLPKYEASSYSDHKIISKPLVFIGSGGDDNSQSTLFTGANQLTLFADPSLDETKKNYSFEGIYFKTSYNTIVPASNLNELKFINFQGKINDNNSDSEDKFVINNLIINRCNIQDLNLSNFSTKRVDIQNTKFSNGIKGGCDSNFGIAALDHCFINSIDSNFIGLIQHSLIYYTYAGNQTSLEDCCYYGESGDSSKDGCTKLNTSSVSNLDNDSSSLGNCTDGTAYGTSGGNTPYTLYPQYPTADVSVDKETNKANSFVDYDSINKKLTITVKRLGE